MTPPVPNTPVNPPDSPAPPDTAVIAALLERQLKFYEQLHGLSDRQHELVNAGSVDDLLALLSQRQNLVDGLTKVSAELDPHRAALSASWSSLAGDDQRRISGLLDRIQELVKSILDQDGRDRSALERAKGQIGEELQQTTHASRAVNAYRTPAAGYAAGGAASAPRYTDHRG